MQECERPFYDFMQILIRTFGAGFECSMNDVKVAAANINNGGELIPYSQFLNFTQNFQV